LLEGATSEMIERASLKFPHATHLDPRGVKSPEKGRVKLECKSCHVKSADEVKLPTDCGSCHARDDAHDGGFGKDCGRCHSSLSWRGAGVRR